MCIRDSFSGSVSIGGTLTYEDVTNIDSVGIVTAREGIRVPDSKKVQLGDSQDLEIYHNSNNNWIDADQTLYVRAPEFSVTNPNGSEFIARFLQNSSVNLYYDYSTYNTPKLQTTATGVTVNGTLAATAITGDGSGLTGIAVGLTTEALVKTNGQTASLDLSKDDHKVTATGTVTINVTGGSEGDSHSLRIENSGTANVGFSTYFKFPSGATPSLPSTGGAISLISFTVHKAGSVGIATVLLAGASVNFS